MNVASARQYVNSYLTKEAARLERTPDTVDFLAKLYFLQDALTLDMPDTADIRSKVTGLLTWGNQCLSLHGAPRSQVAAVIQNLFNTLQMAGGCLQVNAEGPFPTVSSTNETLASLGLAKPRRCKKRDSHVTCFVTGDEAKVKAVALCMIREGAIVSTNPAERPYCHYTLLCGDEGEEGGRVIRVIDIDAVVHEIYGDAIQGSFSADAAVNTAVVLLAVSMIAWAWFHQPEAPEPLLMIAPPLEDKLASSPDTAIVTEDHYRGIQELILQWLKGLLRQALERVW